MTGPSTDQKTMRLNIEATVHCLRSFSRLMSVLLPNYSRAFNKTETYPMFELPKTSGTATGVSIVVKIYWGAKSKLGRTFP